MTFAFHYAALSDVGKVRKNNQDSGYAGPNLLILADGMGGPAGGDIASSIAVANLHHLDQAPAPNADQALHEAAQAVESAHRELVEMSNYKHELKGLGTTCITLRRGPDFVALTHIGDSRAYLLREQQLSQITKDHSLVQQLVDTGQIQPEEMKTHPMRSVLIRVLGDAKQAVGSDLETIVWDVALGDRWLLCSDGLCGFVEESTIAQVLYQAKTVEDACSKLLDLALRAGGPDNITCVVAEVVPADSPQTGTTPTAIEAANRTNSETAKAAKANLATAITPQDVSSPLVVGAASTDRLATLRQEKHEQSVSKTVAVPAQAASPDPASDSTVPVQVQTSTSPATPAEATEAASALPILTDPNQGPKGEDSSLAEDANAGWFTRCRRKLGRFLKSRILRYLILGLLIIALVAAGTVYGLNWWYSGNGKSNPTTSASASNPAVSPPSPEKSNSNSGTSKNTQGTQSDSKSNNSSNNQQNTKGNNSDSSSNNQDQDKD